MQIDRFRYEVEFDEDFSTSELDLERWLPYYLPHWAGVTRSAARYAIGNSVLSLRIDADQPVWQPEVAPGMRVSSLQTGHRVGQHRTDERLAVRQDVPDAALYTPQHGLVEARVCAVAEPACMVALWLVGLEDRPENSAEICVFEIFGRDVTPDAAEVGVGVKAHGDPRVTTEFVRVRLDGDATDWHVYAVEWDENVIRFFLDDRLVKTVAQSIGYPMQLMLNVYEFDAPAERGGDDYPVVFPVDFVRGYRRREEPLRPPPEAQTG